MKMSITQSITISVFLLLLPHICTAQQNQNEDDIKLGLALSGGGARGFAHIGVLKVFKEEGIPIHMVSGTSMGAIVGSLYAIGYTPEEIEEIALSTDWNILFNDNYRINPQDIANSVSNKDTYLFTFPFDGRQITLPTGLTDGQNISMILYRLMLPYHDLNDFTSLPIPFASVATNLATGQAHTFTKGYLPDAVRASSAIPSILKPVKLNGETYIDGGIARNIPAEDVKNLGADVVIASDVGDPVKHLDSLKTFVDILFQSVGFHQQESNIEQQKQTDFYIRPEIRDFSSFSYDQAQLIIKRGEQAAREIMPELKSYLADHRLYPSQFKPISSIQNDTLLISGISFSNISGLLQQQANLALDIQTPSRLTITDIEQKVNRLYSSGLFSQISYRLQNQSDPEKKQLVLEFQKKEQEYAGFSMRYDSQYKASLLFGGSITDNIFENDRLTMQLRAGEILELISTYNTLVILAPLSQINFGIDFQRSPINFYNQNQALSTVDVERLTFRSSASVRFWRNTDFETGLEAELYNLNQAVGNTLVLGNTRFLLKPFVRLGFNTLNQPYFPSKGQLLDFKTVVSNRSWGGLIRFYPSFRKMDDNLFTG
jgi:NTE family protein